MKAEGMSVQVRTVLFLLALAAAGALARSGALDGTAGLKVLRDARNNGPNEAEMDVIVKGYYEALADVERDPEWTFGGPIRDWIKKMLGVSQRPSQGRPEDNWESLGVIGGTIDLPPEEFLEHELRPGWSGLHKGAMTTFNRFGHRDDDDYGMEKPAGVFRVALCGSSNSMGAGVEREEMFEWLLERRLNAELAGRGGHERYEIINMSVPNYHLLERVYVAQEKAPAFEPDLILIEVTMRDLRKALYNGTIDRVRDGRELHFDFVRRIVERTGAKPAQSENNLGQRFMRYRKELAAGALDSLAAFSRRRGIPVALCVLRLEVDGVDKNLEWIAQASDNAGLITLRVWNAYQGHTAREMYLIPGRDYHPTPLGHRVLADELFEDMMAEPRIGRLLTRRSEVGGGDGG